jgi:hypothetical protein
VRDRVHIPPGEFPGQGAGGYREPGSAPWNVSGQISNPEFDRGDEAWA